MKNKSESYWVYLVDAVHRDGVFALFMLKKIDGHFHMNADRKQFPVINKIVRTHTHRKKLFWKIFSAKHL